MVYIEYSGGLNGWNLEYGVGIFYGTLVLGTLNINDSGLHIILRLGKTLRVTNASLGFGELDEELSIQPLRRPKPWLRIHRRFHVQGLK